VASESERADFQVFLEQWPADRGALKRLFLALSTPVLGDERVEWSFVARPGVSHSFRVQTVKPRPGRNRPLFCMIDVVSEVESPCWLSVCFYEDEISDPEDLGEAVPAGLFQETGYCFDVDDADAAVEEYVKARMREAFVSASAAG